MPTISVFYGIVIRMFWDEHGPPHFHAMYAEYDAVIGVRELRVLRGSLPRKAMALVLEWAKEHQDELLEDWNLCVQKKASRPDRTVEVVPPIRPSAPWSVTSLTVFPDWRLEVSFFDGTSGKVQMRELIFGSRSDGTFFEPLRDAAEFRKAEIVLGAVEWPNGANIDPDWMHEEIRRHGRWVVPAD